MESQRAYSIYRPHADVSTQKGVRDYWADYSDAHFLNGYHAYSKDRPYQVQTIRQATNLYALHTFRQEGQKEVTHTARHSRGRDEFYHLFVVTEGESILTRQGEAEAEAPAGTALLATQCKPFDMRVGGFGGFVLAVPYVELNERLGSKSPEQTAFNTNQGLGRLVTDMLRGLFEQRDHVSEREFNAVCDRLVELLCMLLVGDDCPDSNQAQAIASAMRRYVHQHAGNPALSLSAVATALGWSPRRLQEVMSQAGTSYRELVREERLEAARRLLSDPVELQARVSDVAVRCGFASGNVLSTLFKERYGETPRDYRLRVTSGSHS